MTSCYFYSIIFSEKIKSFSKKISKVKICLSWYLTAAGKNCYNNNVYLCQGGGNIKRRCRIAGLFLAALLLPVPYVRTECEALEEAELTYMKHDSYSQYYAAHADAERPDVSVIVQGDDYLTCEHQDGVAVGSIGSGQESRDNVLIWDAEDGTVSYAVDVPETGFYCMAFSYLPIPSHTTSIVFSVAVDGEIPFDTASRATLNKVFVNDGDIRTDSKGNQLRPTQKQDSIWMETPLMDVDGLFNEPIAFYLEKGEHEISFEIERGYFVLDWFSLYNPEVLPSYEEYVLNTDTTVTPESTPSTCIRIEGEDASFKSSPTLCPTSDNTSSLASPSDPAKTVFNTIGAGTWNQALQTITWNIPADELHGDGWYKLGIKARQNEIRGLCSNRRIYIDGKVPCEELNEVQFPYDNDWQLITPENAEGEPLYVYLTGSTDHTITMEVVPGEIGTSIRELEPIVKDISTYYRKILMITGPTPDKYTDYYVHERIPELLNEFAWFSEELKRIQSDMESLTGESGSEAAALERMAVILDKCTAHPLRIPDYLRQIKDNLTALSAWMVDYRRQPLELDYIELASADRKLSPVKGNWFQNLSFGWKRFCSSFTEDYTQLTDVAEENTIEVWVASGREQAMLIKALTESEFAAEHDVNVAVNLVTGGILEAALAGKNPDVALFLGGEFPVDLAARGLLTDLEQFDGYADIRQRFQKNATVPYQYNGGTYALPLTQSWAMMFYRKDILSELGISTPPETWDDLTDMLPALQRNYMSVGLVLPVVSGTNASISPATESGHTFAAMMLQSGLNYYNDARTATTFDDIRAVDAFERWTDYYTEYGFQQSYDAFSRFRTGEYPIVISDYSFFNQLSVASPEIKGLWGFTSIPGTVQADGTISHAVNSNGSGAVIFESCQDKKSAWEFLKWFTSADVQAEYGMQTEGLLGQLGRLQTANTEALQQLSWSKEELYILLAAQEELVEIPIIPASYAVTRNIMNAFRETVDHHEDSHDTLLWYNRDINDEIMRKRQNLGLSGDG